MMTIQPIQNNYIVDMKRRFNKNILMKMLLGVIVLFVSFLVLYQNTQGLVVIFTSKRREVWSFVQVARRLKTLVSRLLHTRTYLED